uniref:Secreted protein n=1 Tax=Trypanosoma vivax (strain Y486) TaxID=1055687 RepID=G0UD93_TRYVY|nr:hypothetical protein, unlikely [Trypanosoma vivax Y486]
MCAFSAICGLSLFLFPPLHLCASVTQKPTWLRKTYRKERKKGKKGTVAAVVPITELIPMAIRECSNPREKADWIGHARKKQVIMLEEVKCGNLKRITEE